MRVTVTAENGAAKQEVAHTLDFTSGGVRLGSIRSPFRLQEIITVQYRQHRMQFRVVWIKSLKTGKEYQVGLEALGNISQMWGLRFSEAPCEPLKK